VTPSLSIYLLTQWSLGFVIVPESCVALAMKGILMPWSLRSSICCPVKNNPRETSLGCREGGGERKKSLLDPMQAFFDPFVHSTTAEIVLPQPDKVLLCPLSGSRV